MGALKNVKSALPRPSKIFSNRSMSYHKLKSSNLIVAMSPSNNSHSNSDSAIIIFDWDDTILPSSFVDRAKAENLSELPQQHHNLFREIEQCTEKCLAAAAKHGEVGLCLCYHTGGDFYAICSIGGPPVGFSTQVLFLLFSKCLTHPSLIHTSLSYRF